VSAGPRLVVVGPPGAGKSTVGRLVADALGVGFRDTDADVEAAAGESIADIFVLHGEEDFRARERDAVVRALAEHDGVLAVGGGAVLDERTRADLRGRPVLHLEVSLASAAPRVGLTGSRPLLLGNPRKQWLELAQARLPLYAEVASITVSTDGRTPEQVRDAVLAELGTA
jgi:shikimate kinase